MQSFSLAVTVSALALGALAVGQPVLTLNQSSALETSEQLARNERPNTGNAHRGSGRIQVLADTYSVNQRTV